MKNRIIKKALLACSFVSLLHGVTGQTPVTLLVPLTTPNGQQSAVQSLSSVTPSVSSDSTASSAAAGVPHSSIIASVSQQPPKTSADVFGGSLGDVALYLVAVNNYSQQKTTLNELSVAQQVADMAGLNLLAQQVTGPAIASAENRSPESKLLLGCQGASLVEAGVTAAKLPQLSKTWPAVGVGVAAICTALTPVVNSIINNRARSSAAVTGALATDSQFTVVPGGVHAFLIMADQVQNFKPIHVDVR